MYPDVKDRLEPIHAAWELGVLSDEEVALLEGLFTEARSVDVAGRDLVPGRAVWGAGGPSGLAYVVQGSVREVVLRRRTDGGRQAWQRGRDPQVVDVLGAGCFLGLYQLEDLFLDADEDGVPDGPVSPVVQTRAYYANPGRRVGEGLLRVRYLPPDALERLIRHPGLHSWLKGMWVGCGLGERGRRKLLDDADRHDRVWRELRAHPILGVLGRPSLNALVQASIPMTPGEVFRAGTGRSVGPTDVFRQPLNEDGSWRRAGDPADQVQLLVDGQAELVLPAQGNVPERVVGMLRPGDVIDLQAAVAEQGSPPSRPLSVYLSSDAFVLTWPLGFFQTVVRGCPAAWHRLQRFVAPRVVDDLHGGARVTVVAPGGAHWGRPGDARAFAYGTALWLATPTGIDARKEVPPHVVLVDVEASDTALDDELGSLFDQAWRDPDWPAGSSMDAGASLHAPPGHRRRTALPGLIPRGGALDVVVPDDDHELVDLVDHLRALDGVTDVVVHLPFGRTVREDVPAACRNSDEAGRAGDGRMLSVRILDGLRILPHAVMWLCDDANGWYTLTDEAPDRLYRADRLTRAFLDQARERAAIFMTQSEDLEVDDRPGNKVDGMMVVPMTDAGLAGQVGGLPPMVDPRSRVLAGDDALAAALRLIPGLVPRTLLGYACARACRMISGTTIGLALGGGGTWGSSHIAVLRALSEEGIDIDYVSGTSFGALVGGIYAGGGSPALDRFLELCALDPAADPLRGLPRSLIRTSAGRVPGLQALAPMARWLREEQVAFSNTVAAALRLGMLGAPAALDALVDRIVTRTEGSWAPRKEGSPCLRETHIPFFAVASNLTTHEPFVPYHHTLGGGVRAASSLPPGFPGYWFKGAKMVDGAALANVPAAVLRANGADFVIAINVVGAAHVQRERGHLGPRSGTVVERVKDTATTAWLTLWKAGTAEAERYADVLVDVRIQGIGLSQTWKAPEIVRELGVQLANERVAERIFKRYRAREPGVSGPLRVRLEYDARDPR